MHIDGTASLGFSNVAPKQFVGRDIPGGPERQPAGATSDTDGARAGGSAEKAVPTRLTSEVGFMYINLPFAILDQSLSVSSYCSVTFTCCHCRF